MWGISNGNREQNAVDHYNKARVGMEEIQRLIKSRKEKIDLVLRETVQIEEKYLSDAECNLIKAIKLAKDSMVALESSNKALKDELAANAVVTADAVRERDSALVKLKNEEKLRLETAEDCKRKLQTAEETHLLFKTQTQAWIAREDSSLDNLHERLDMLSKELAVKTAECVRLSKELIPYHETLKRNKELEAELSDKTFIITSLKSENSEQKKKIAAYEMELAEMAQMKLLLAQLREKLSVSEADRARLKVEVDKLMERLLHLEPFEMEVVSLKKNLVSAQSEISKLMEELSRRTSEYNTLSFKYDELKTSASASANSVLQLQAEVSNASQKYEASEAALVALREKYAALEVELSISRDRVVTLETELMRWKENVSQHETKSTQLKSEIEAISQSLRAMEMRAAEAEAAKKSAEGKLKEMEVLVSLKDDEITELKTKLQSNTIKLSQAQSEAARSQEASEEKHASMQKMTDTVKAQEQALEHMKADVQYYHDQMGELEAKYVNSLLMFIYIMCTYICFFNMSLILFVRYLFCFFVSEHD